MTTTYSVSSWRLSISWTPAYLTGWSSATSVAATWAAVTDGSFTISIDWTSYDITGINFTWSLSMVTVAANIQAAIRAATSSTETVTWSTNHFIISSVNTTSSSAITVTSAVSPSTGTDISGVWWTAFMDSDTWHWTVTNAVSTQTSYTARSWVSASTYTWRTWVLMLYSYLTDVWWNYVTDRRWYRIIVNWSDFYRWTTYIPTR